MSSVVLARKYRPKTFEQMVGQEHVVRALTNALRAQRLHHAYLFTGTRGIGKTTVSRILAKSLNCTGPDGNGGITATPCGVCSACTEIDADRYIDYIELDAASNRGIAEVQDLIERAAYKPGVGRFKVFMIDEAHQLTKDAFNALLKTLEEPPEYLKFVLATTDPEKMLPTVLSRCLQFNLRPMPPEVVREHLESVLRSEGVTFDDTGVRLLSRAARGSMRDALSLADQAIAYGAGMLAGDVVRAMLGAVERSRAAGLVESLAARDARALLEGVDELRLRGLAAAGALDEIAALLQQMAIAQAVPEALDAADPEQADALRLAALLPPDETQLLYSMVLQGRGELALVGDEYAALTMVLLRFVAFAPAAGAAAPPSPPPRAVPRATPAVASAVSSAAAAPSAAAPAATAALPLPTAAEGRGEDARGHTAQSSARHAAEPEPPPWLDAPPPAGFEATEVRSPPLRAAAPGAIVVPAPVANVDFEGTALGDRWHAVVAPLAERGVLTALVRELAWQAELIGVAQRGATTVWRLRVERESLRQGAWADKLAAVLSSELGAPQAIEVEPGVAADSPARRAAAEQAERQAEAERIICDDVVVREVMQQFKTARIVPGSIKPL